MYLQVGRRYFKQYYVDEYQGDYNFFEIAWSFSADRDTSQVIMKIFEPFLYHKNSGANLLNFGPFGACSHGAGKLAEFFLGSTSVFMI